MRYERSCFASAFLNFWELQSKYALASHTLLYNFMLVLSSFHFVLMHVLNLFIWGMLFIEVVTLIHAGTKEAFEGF
jgi:uncharacterized membrane protein